VDGDDAVVSATIVGGVTFGVTGLNHSAPSETAASFDGTGHIVLPTTDETTATIRGRTVMAVIKPTNLTGVRPLVTKTGSYRLTLNAGVPEFAVTIGGVERVVSAPAITANAVHAITGRFNGSRLSLHVDDQIYSLAAKAVSGLPDTNGNDVLIGYDGTRHFIGVIGHVASERQAARRQDIAERHYHALGLTSVPALPAGRVKRRRGGAT
jgi:hypothetical protein